VTDILIDSEDIEKIKAGYIASLNLCATLSKEKWNYYQENVWLKMEIAKSGKTIDDLGKEIEILKADPKAGKIKSLRQRLFWWLPGKEW
jgi:hypothetical protein